MSLIFRLAGRNATRQLFSMHRCSPIITTISNTKSVGHKCLADADESHDTKNLRLKRPLSPHLTIYSPQMTSMLSITQRAMGMILAGYTMLFALTSMLLPEPLTSYIDELECMELGCILISIGKMMLCFPLCYHYFNGIRHLIWDTNTFLKLRQVYMTGYIMLCTAFLATAGLCLL